MPSYGEMTCGASLAFWKASRGHSVHHELRGGSLLSKNFNVLWCMLLNSMQSDDPPEYFAMLHSDVAAEPGWLDLMISILERQKLDLLSAVVPIKSQHGLTSTAVARVDGSTWRVGQRLTMTEVYGLPPTFTSEDLGRDLLVNTGCWVAKVGDWCKEVSFTINDRIILSPDGTYHSETEPEDWYFSRLCHDLGLRIGATRSVRIAHDGSASFRNDQPWGTHKHDSDMADGPVVPASGLRYPHEVEGWLTYREGRALYDLCKDKRVLEIGSYCGKSTICIAQSAESVTCVDTFDGRGTASPRSTLEDFQRNVRACGLQGKINPIIGTSDTADIEGEHFDVVFIDGSHDEASVEKDIDLAESVLTPDGIICMHDYQTHPGDARPGWDPGVTAAVDRHIEQGAVLLARHDSLAVIRPKQKEPAL